jgi:MoaA/NifB/PqqE/SkfB family radical SAM enzyme
MRNYKIAGKDFNTDFVTKEQKKVLEDNEEETNEPKKDCMKCAYRNREIGHCWYTVITNESSYATSKSCSHFVNLEKVAK